MAGLKKTVSFDVQSDVIEMLEAAAEKYNLPDRDKALRAILDYVATEAEWDDIFGKRRCVRCGGRPGWTPAGD